MGTGMTGWMKGMADNENHHLIRESTLQQPETSGIGLCINT